MKVIISGYGYVGKATNIVLKNYSQSKIQIHDPALGYIADQWYQAKYHFVCVPTPAAITNNEYKKHDVSIVKQAIQYAESKEFNGITVIRSTMSPTDFDLLSDLLDENTIVWPEFLRKATFEKDAIAPLLSIIGGENCDVFKSDLNYKFLTVGDCRAACMAKMAINSYLAARVIIANDLKTACDKLDVNWDGVKTALAADPRLGYGHWNQPGPDNKYGFGGGCLPKDTDAMASLLLDLDLVDNYAKWAIDKNKKLRQPK